MSFNASNAKKHLEQFDFSKLFTEELGWDQHKAELFVDITGTTFALKAAAQKRGMVAWVCHSPEGQRIPDRANRKKIEHQVAKSTLEHLIIFIDAKRAEQIWCWARREAGKPASVPEHFWYATSGNRGFLQKLERLFISFEEEETLSLPDVTTRARAAFDIERVTKRFYDQFKTEHEAFLDFISGITEVADREWYASLMLNRMMFIYFMQRKGFLNGERDYLRDRLALCQRDKGQDKFYSFYRYFLLRLFHEGLGGRARNPELDKLLGRIPYLNGGLFEKHIIEERFPDIVIPDEAFARIFAYFDRYQWHLDERPLRENDEINPDVLGYIFEKYINQKQMGAYYTKEDITEYISKITVIPFLFDAAMAKCKVAFENPGGPTIWDHLRDNPDRYIYTAVKHGTATELPPDIAAGITDVQVRRGWNRSAPTEFGLPTEIWREVVARRAHYVEVRAKLAAGEVHEINDLITLNLDIRQFAQDVIERCEGPDLLRAFWKAIEGVTVLDPTCGSGAFLFAALNILEPLYATCLDRMEAFVADLERSAENHAPKKFEDFKGTLEKVGAHPNARYFTLKSIILNNLFGVDIMEEAVEICKLRLFLKLAAQVDPDQKHENLGIEPLPDIDFNIRAGNTLVGYATFADVNKALTSKLKLDDTADRILIEAADLDQKLYNFRARQTSGDLSVPSADKQKVLSDLSILSEKLNRYLARANGVSDAIVSEYSKWLKSHQPFHWFIEFYGIMSNGGFDVIVGNPPWKELSTIRRLYTVRGYTTESSGNLYALCTERSVNLLSPRGFLSFIVQLPIVSSDRMQPIRNFLSQNSSFVATITCDDRPGKLFDGLQHCRSAIFLIQHSTGSLPAHIWSSGYRRWATEVRDTLFPLTTFTKTSASVIQQAQFPKIASPLQASVYGKVHAKATRPLKFTASSHSTSTFVFYQESAQYWVKAAVGLPFYAKNGQTGAPAHGRYLFFSDERTTKIVCAILNSSLFYGYFIAYGDCFHVSDSLVTSFPVPPAALEDETLESLGATLMRDLNRNAERKTIDTKVGDKISYAEYRVGDSKLLINEIDKVLAGHYGFTENELDQITSFDIKYRLGREEESDGDK